MSKMKRTTLTWDKYIDYLIDAINGSKFMKRAADKPMSTPKTANESHLSTRESHLRESADVAKRLANGLGLNGDYLYAAMLMHDAGHPFSAHEGEEIFSHLGEIYNTQYFHHNVKGIEIILSEDICGKAINKIPNIENNPKLREKLEEEFPYFLDIIISHDGEANEKEMMKKETPYPTMQDAIRTKMRIGNSSKKAKFVAQTPEGKLAKFADVIAYLSSDMQDGFRLGILKGFDDDYLELFGEMLSTGYPGNRKEKIDEGKRIIEQIKQRNLREKSEARGILGEKNPQLQQALDRILSRMKSSNLNIHEGSITQEQIDEIIQKIVEEEKEIFKKNRLEEFFNTKGATIPEDLRANMEKQIEQKVEDGIALTDEEEKFAETLNGINSEVNKIEEFVAKMIRARSTVVYEVTSRMKEYFIDDLIRNSQNESSPTFSKAAWDLYWRAKKLNYDKFVQYTKWSYQVEHLPTAVLELTNHCAEGLVKSGIIRDKFYDESVRRYVKDKDALRYMKTKYRPEAKYTSWRKEHGIGDIKSSAKPIKGNFTGNKQYELMRLYNDIYSYTQNEEEVFAIRFENTFNAIKTRVSEKVNTALEDEHQSKNPIPLYKIKVQSQIDRIRQEIIDTYGTTQLTQNQKEEFIGKKIEEQLATMEEKMAIQLSTDYLAGMTDKSFIDIATKTGYINQEDIQQSERGVITDGSNVSKLIQEINRQEEEKKETIIPEQPEGEDR